MQVSDLTTEMHILQLFILNINTHVHLSRAALPTENMSCAHASKNVIRSHQIHNGNPRIFYMNMNPFLFTMCNILYLP